MEQKFKVLKDNQIQLFVNRNDNMCTINFDDLHKQKCKMFFGYENGSWLWHRKA